MSQHIGHRIRGGTYSTYVTGSTVGEPTGSINGTNENDASLSVKYSVWTFTKSGTFTTSAPITCDILIVAGGGGGGNGWTGGTAASGGGGAGGVKYFKNYSLLAGSYSVFIGDGGIPGTGGNLDGTIENGTNSYFGSLIATGGGGGAHRPSGPSYVGGAGGSGGGGANHGTGAGGSGTANQGNDGSGTIASDNSAAGGGGGAGSAGSSAVGGSGVTEFASYVYDWTAADGSTARLDINGTGNIYASGGDGGSETGAHLNEARVDEGHRDMLDNTGNGGDGGYGAGNQAGGQGGSGIVIVRFTS